MQDRENAPGVVMVGLSGGVDSAVAAMLLQRQGYEVRALFMKNWEEDDSAQYCAAEEDLAAAGQIAGKLAIPLDAINFSTEYWERVFTHFLNELKAGHTPNPDILCNQEIKFRAFLDYALAQGADKIATGHYACLQPGAGGVTLRRAADANKDQTYFLHQVSPEALTKTLFPLCRYKKSAVRQMAKDAGFSNFDRKDSTGICFIGERRFDDFIAKYIPNAPGPIRHVDGDIVGEHRGLTFYTIGQRKGLGIGGRSNADETPWFVVDKLIDSNTLLVVQGNEHPALYAHGLYAQNLHWIAREPPATPYRCTAKTRHRQTDQACTVEHAEADLLRVTFDQPIRAVAPGQYVVFYSDQLCLGGGVIKSAFNKLS